MLIQLQEINQTDNGFQISITFDANTRFDPIFISNAQEESAESNFEWYFEGYIKEPHLAQIKVQRCRDAIFVYGKSLFEQIFNNRKIYSLYKQGIDAEGFENLTVEIIGNSLEFQAIHWETLQDPDFDVPLSVQGAVFYRKNLKPNAIDAKVNSFPYINLLIVTARPGEEEDINYRTIQRPLVDVIRTSRLRVVPHILRPGTFESLINHLDEMEAGYYHIIHFDLHGKVLDYKELNRERKKNNVSFEAFDFEANNFQVNWGLENIEEFEGKKGFLFFESGKKKVAIAVEAVKLAQQLQKYRIPVCFLNACQSAKQQNTANETSIGKILIESGMQLVLAMRYSVSVSAATILMKTVYERLLEGRAVEQAITFGRKALNYNKNRNAKYGETIELEDWLLPIVYKNRDVVFNLRDFKDNQEEEEFYLLRERRHKPRKVQYGFQGRDLDILKIEKLLLQHNHLLLQGLGGQGKTTLLDYLAAWWSETNFVTNTFYFAYDQKAWTLEHILLEIANKVLHPNGLNQFYSKSFIVQKQKVIEILNNRRHCLILDNFEPVRGEKLAIANTLSEQEREDLREFLSKINGSVVIYGSRASEEWLKHETFQENIYILPNLDKEATYQFAKAILETKGLDIHNFISDPDFERLLALLGGNPLIQKVILPHLQHKTINQIIQDLQAADIHLDASGKKKRR